MILNLSVKALNPIEWMYREKCRTLLHFCLTKSFWYPFLCNKIIFIGTEIGNKADFWPFSLLPEHLWMILLPNRSGVWLPTTTDRQIPETEVSCEMERGLLLKSCMILEVGRLLPQSPFPPELPEENSVTFCRTIPSCAHSSFSHLKILSFRNHTWLQHNHPVGLACSQ